MMKYCLPLKLENNFEVRNTDFKCEILAKKMLTKLFRLYA